MEEVDTLDQVLEQITALLERGEHDKALNLIDETLPRHPRSDKLHYAKGRVYFSLATTDGDAKAKHLEEGLRFAELAAELLPHSEVYNRLVAEFLDELQVFNKESIFHHGFVSESLSNHGTKDIFRDDLCEESRLEDDVKLLEDMESAKKSEFDAKREVEAGNTEDEEKEDSEVVAADRRQTQAKALMEKLKDDEEELLKTLAIMKKLKDNEEDILKYKSFWKIKLSDEKKRGFGKVSIEELEIHLKSLKDESAVILLLEAVSFAKLNKTWTFWECYDCVMKFGDCNSFTRHYWAMHGLESRSMWHSDYELWKECTEVIILGKWKPLDINEAVVNPKKSEKGLNGCKSSSVDKESSKTSMDHPKLPISDDVDRSMILSRIHNILLLLCKSICLPQILVRWIMDYARSQLNTIIPESLLSRLGLKRLQLICFLDASQLTEVLNFLKDVVHSVGLSEKVDMNASFDEKPSDHHLSDIKEKVLFSKDFTCLLLDERILQGRLNAANYVSAVAGDGSAVDKSEDDVLPYGDNIVSWLYMGSNCAEGLESWKSLIKSRRRQANKSHEAFLQKLSVMPTTDVEADKISGELKAMQKLENLFHEETEKKEKSPEIESPLYVDLLKKRQKDLLETGDSSNGTELGVIFKILGTAKDKTNHCIQLALKQLKIQMFKDLCCLDGITLRRLRVLSQYTEKLRIKTVCDYRSIIVPMLKSFLQRHLKDLYEDAKEKSKAAEQFLLALEAKEKISKDVDDKKKKKNKKKKKKKKKKNKNSEIPKEPEATDGSRREHSELTQKDEEQNDDTNSKNEDFVDEPKQLAISDEEQMLKKHLEKQRQFEDEASLKANASRSIGDSARNNATDAGEDFQPHQKDDENPHTEFGDSERVDASKNMSAIEEGTPEEHLEYRGQIEIEAKQKCIAEKSENMGENIVGNVVESVSDISLEHNGEEYEKRFLSDIEKAICLSLDCYEKRYGPLSATDVKDGKTSRLDVQSYVIMQSQCYLRQIRDEFMSRTDTNHTHAGDPCFDCAFRDTLAARRIASTQMPEAGLLLSSRKLSPVEDFFKEWLNEDNQVDKVISISTSAHQLKPQLIDVVRKVVVALEHEKQTKKKNIGDTSGGNVVVDRVADISSHLNEEYEKRFLSDIEKAICLSLDCFETRYGSLLPTDVNDDKTSRLDIQIYVIMQSQWYLRQIRDEFMSRLDISHTHAGDPCFRCAYRYTFAAVSIASRDMPEVDVQLFSEKLSPIEDFIEEGLILGKQVNKVVNISSNAHQLKQQLIDMVRKIVVELEHTRQINNIA